MLWRGRGTLVAGGALGNPEAEQSPLVGELLAVIERLAQENARQAESIQQLRDEIAVLKGEKGKPKFKPSKLDQEAGKPAAPEKSAASDQKRPGSAKRRKTAELTIHEERSIPPAQALPPGSRLKGYREFVVQDLRIAPHNIRYRLELWQTPDGRWQTGTLPEATRGEHFGPQFPHQSDLALAGNRIDGAACPLRQTVACLWMP